MQFIAIFLIILGLFIILSGIIGLFRFPDFYTKLHAAGLIDSCGVPMTLLGVTCLHDRYIIIFKLIIITLLILLLSPVSTHLLGKTAINK